MERDGYIYRVTVHGSVTVRDGQTTRDGPRNVTVTDNLMVTWDSDDKKKPTRQSN